MKYYETPEVIGQVEEHRKGSNSDPMPIGDRIVGITIFRDDDQRREGELQIDIRQYDRTRDNIVIKLPLLEVMAAITTAAIHREEC